MKEFDGEYIIKDVNSGFVYIVDKLWSVNYHRVRVHFTGKYDVYHLVDKRGIKNMVDYEFTYKIGGDMFSIKAANIHLFDYEENWIEFRFNYITADAGSEEGLYFVEQFNNETRKPMSKTKGCKNCWHNYHCPMPQEGYDYEPETCPHNPDNKHVIKLKDDTQPVRTIDDFESIVETIIEDSSIPYEEIADSLEYMAGHYRKKSEQTNE